MGCIGRTVRIDRVVGITVVSDDDGVVAVLLSSFYHAVHADVDGHYRLLDGVIDAGMAYHIPVGEVQNDAVIYLRVERLVECCGYLGCRHLGLQVIGGYLRTGNKDAVLVLELVIASAAEEEGYMRELLRLGDTQLAHAGFGYDLAQGVLYVLLREEDMQAFVRTLVGCHAVVVQPLDGHHAFCGFVFLCQHNGHLAGAVVAVVEEDDGVAFLNRSQRFAVTHVHDGLDELIGYLGVVAGLHGVVHILILRTDTVYQQVITYLDAFPAFVAVHGIKTALDRSYLAARLLHVGLQLVDEADTRARVGVATVHETMYIGAAFQTILLSDVQ